MKTYKKKYLGIEYWPRLMGTGYTAKIYNGHIESIYHADSEAQIKRIIKAMNNPF